MRIKDQHGHIVSVTIADVAAVVYDQAKYLAREFPELLAEDRADDDEPVCTDIRLQIVDRGWEAHTGDAQYDQDHRGHWGATRVHVPCTWRQAHETARDLINEAADDAAQDC